MHLHIVMPIVHLCLLSLASVVFKPTCELSRPFLFHSAFVFRLLTVFQLLIRNTFSARFFKTILPRTSVVRVKGKKKISGPEKQKGVNPVLLNLS